MDCLISTHLTVIVLFKSTSKIFCFKKIMDSKYYYVNRVDTPDLEPMDNLYYWLQSDNCIIVHIHTASPYCCHINFMKDRLIVTCAKPSHNLNWPLYHKIDENNCIIDVSPMLIRISKNAKKTNWLLVARSKKNNTKCWWSRKYLKILKFSKLYFKVI